MKQVKQRVVAIDYFRGLFIILILLTHSMIFSMPFAYLGGATKLWTGPAEMFMLLSGITYAIVRGNQIKPDFKKVAFKTWKRATSLYLLSILLVSLSLVLSAVLTTHHLTNYVFGSLPTSSGLSLLWKMITLQYYYGSASFLMLYGVYLAAAPFAMYVLRTKYWVIVPIISVALFSTKASQSAGLTSYSPFIMWQIYFFLGMTITSFREQLSSLLQRSKPMLVNAMRIFTISGAALIIALSFIAQSDIFTNLLWLNARVPITHHLTGAYVIIMSHHSTLESLFRDNRYGALRPAVSLWVFAALILIYKKYERQILDYSGRAVIAFGRETLAVFAAQAFAVPILAAIPLKRTMFFNIILLLTLYTSMWAVVQRRRIASGFINYTFKLKLSYNDAKYAYLSRYEDS
jgi:hypothetical protein